MTWLSQNASLMVLGIVVAVVAGVFGLHIGIVRMASGNYRSLLKPTSFIAPIAAIILLLSALVATACPQPFVFWASLEMATLGAGAFVGLVFAMNAGTGTSSGNLSTSQAAAVSNIALVADWITKTLLGATLINLKELVGWIWNAASEAGAKLYPGASFTGAPVLIVVFSSQFFFLGLLLGLLVVKVYLSGFLAGTSPSPSFRLEPAAGTLGQNVSVSITGQGTHFVEGTTTADFGEKITVSGLSVTGPQTAWASLAIAADAATGPRDVVLTTAGETVSLKDGFRVSEAAAHVTMK